MVRSTGFSRRDLLKGAGVAAAAMAFPTIVPSSVFGQNAPSNRVNLAAIGVGSRGTGDCGRRFLPLAEVRFVAAVDCYKSKREAFAKLCNGHYKADVCKPYADFREVLALKDVDGIVVSTPDHWHVPIAFYAAQAKKDMYVEKPLGVAMAWAWKLREEIVKNKVVFQYGTQQRGDQQQFRRACELALNGYIGKVDRVDVWSPALCGDPAKAGKMKYGKFTAGKEVPADLDYEMWMGPSPKREFSPERCQTAGSWHMYDHAIGFIAGWGAHPLDIAQWGLDLDKTGPVKIEGKGTVPPEGSFFDTVDSWDFHCAYANGIKMHFMSHDVAKPIVAAYHPSWNEHGTTFHGTEGWISVNRGALYSSNKALQPKTAEIKEGEKKLKRVDSQAADFVSCMKSRQETISPLESAIRSDTISHLCNISVRTGRPIKWDPEKEQIVGDEEAAKLLNRPMREPWKL